jgi:hypothetical protein
MSLNVLRKLAVSLNRSSFVTLMERTVSTLFVVSGDTADKLSAEGNQ